MVYFFIHYTSFVLKQKNQKNQKFKTQKLQLKIKSVL